MMDYFYLIPIGLVLAAAGLLAFMWSLRSGQYDDLDGASERILFDEDRPAPDKPPHSSAPTPPPAPPHTP